MGNPPDGGTGAGPYYGGPGYPAPAPPPRNPLPLSLIIGLGCGGLALILVLGIVATIVIPIMLSARVGSVNERARNTLRSIISAEAAYFVENNRYGSFADLAAGPAPYLPPQFKDGGEPVPRVTVELQAGTDSFTATATAGTEAAPYHQYTADETGLITEL
jgi:type II secretory pathway pseudopilin PulG